jgi:hypothetical protein
MLKSFYGSKAFLLEFLWAGVLPWHSIGNQWPIAQFPAYVDGAI